MQYLIILVFTQYKGLVVIGISFNVLFFYDAVGQQRVNRVVLFEALVKGTEFSIFLA